MKITQTIAVIAVTVACAGLIACSKQENPPPAPAPAPSATQVPQTATTPTPPPAPTAPVVDAAAQELIDKANADAAEKAEGLIDKAKGLAADQRYAEALDTLKELSTIQLTPERQKYVDDLTARIQKAMATAAASGAAKSADGLLGK